jgi:hypothetical protein
MTQLLENYNYQLRFYINIDLSKKLIKKWEILQENKNNKFFYEKMKKYYKLENNKNLLIKEDCLSNDDKKINFNFFYNSNDIILKIENLNKWTFEELDDIIYAFIKTANKYMIIHCINGSIEMINNKLLNKNKDEQDEDEEEEEEEEEDENEEEEDEDEIIIESDSDSDSDSDSNSDSDCDSDSDNYSDNENINENENIIQ